MSSSSLLSSRPRPEEVPPSTKEPSEVQQIIYNISKSSTGIFYLLEKPAKMEIVSNPSVLEHQSSSLLSNELQQPATTTPNAVVQLVFPVDDTVGHNRNKKLLTFRQRNADRLARQHRSMIKNGYTEFDLDTTTSSTSSSDEDDDILTKSLSADLEKKYAEVLNGRVSNKLCVDDYYPFKKQPSRSGIQVSQTSTDTLELVEIGHYERDEDDEVQIESLRNDSVKSEIALIPKSPNCHLNERKDISTPISKSCSPEMKIVEVIEVPESETMEYDETGHDGERKIVVEEKKVLDNSSELNRVSIQLEILKSFRIKTDDGACFNPQDVFFCVGCKDRFFLETGLQDHLDRKTVRIQLSCHSCKSNLQFFNRCKLLLHLQGHGIEPTVDYLVDVASTSPISLNDTKYHFEYESSNELWKEDCYKSQSNTIVSFRGQEKIQRNNEVAISTVLQTSCTQCDDRSPCRMECDATTMSPEVSTEPSLSSISESVILNPSSNELVSIEEGSGSGTGEFSGFSDTSSILQCCEEKLGDIEKLMEHLKSEDKSGLEKVSLFLCPTDGVPSWSRCGYILHKRMVHERSLPYFCPECHTFFQDWELFSTHIKEECFYMSKRVSYACAVKDCNCSFTKKNQLKTSREELIEHQHKEHSRTVILCELCRNQAFATVEWFLKHLSEFHSISVQNEDQLCAINPQETLPSSTTPVEKMSQIVMPGTEPNTCHTLSRPLIQCRVCNFVFANREGFDRHLSDAFDLHMKILNAFECTACLSLFETNDQLKHHRLSPCKNVVAQQSISVEIDVSGNSEDETPVSPSTNSETEGKRKKSSGKKLRPPRVPLRSQPPRSAVANTNAQSLISKATSKISEKAKQLNGPGSRVLADQSNTKKSNAAVIRSSDYMNSLKACQYCDRLTQEQWLKRHEDQCCGKATDLDPGQCLVCKSNLGNEVALAIHGLEHLKEGILVCIFCHNRRLHPSGAGGEEEIRKVLKNHIYHSHSLRASNAAFPQECSLCDDKCNNRKSLDKHMLLHHLEPLPITKNADVKPTTDVKVLEKRRQLINSNNNIIPEGAVEIYYCATCKGKEFSHKNALERHMINLHKIILSNEDLNRLKKISFAKRYLISQSRQPPIKNNNNSYNSNNNARRRPYSTPWEYSTVPFDRRKKPKLTLPTTTYEDYGTTEGDTAMRDDKNEGVILGEGGLMKKIPVVSKARSEDGNLSCLKCKNFSTLIEEEFYNHVKLTHVWSDVEFQRICLEFEERSEFWCPECDMTFVTKPALSMHLKVSHEFVRDIKTYLEKVGYEGNAPVGENQCEVCFQQFADQPELQKHIRTHGMAFLRLQQRKLSATK